MVCVLDEGLEELVGAEAEGEVDGDDAEEGVGGCALELGAEGLEGRCVLGEWLLELEDGQGEV